MAATVIDRAWRDTTPDAVDGELAALWRDVASRGAVARAGVRAQQSVEWALAAGGTDLGVEYTLADEGLVAAAHAAGLTLGVWTVNDAADIRRMLDLGVDIVTSDWPDLARRLRRGGA